jgi:TRAP-type C4-dicarboxylate transport system permease small subunit
VIGFGEALSHAIGIESLTNLFAAWQDGFRAFIFSGSDEVSGYLFAVGTSWSLAYVLCTRGHIRIDALYGHFPLKARGWLDLCALTLLGVFVAAMVYRAFALTYLNIVEYNRSNTNLRIPLAWAQIPWLGGLVLFAIALVLGFLRTLLALIKGDYATAAATAGVATQDEEIENELKGYGIERPHR